jgi:hypothetical protein
MSISSDLAKKRYRFSKKELEVVLRDKGLAKKR